MDTGLSEFVKKLPLVTLPVLNMQEISNQVFVLSFEQTKDFLPGQVVALTLDPQIAPRLYSLCSAPDDTNNSILFNVKADGQLSPRLAQLKTADTIQVSAPFGAFLGDEKPAWWIAAGTGVAPYRSMMRAGLSANKWLIHGGRTAASFYFHNEFLETFGERYVRCCSQEKGEGLHEGRLTQWLHDCNEIPVRQMFYLCGSSEMVVEVRDILIAKGVEIENIMSEIYF